MTFSELYENKNKLPLIDYRVTKRYEDAEGNAKVPMRCNIKNIVLDGVDEEMGNIYKLILDFKTYEDYNNSVDTHNYYDKNGKATLMYSESKFYNNGIEEFYVDGTQNIEEYFTPNLKE